MDDVELLEWQFKIAKMDSIQLEATVREMTDPAAKPFSLHDPEAMARLERTSIIGNTEAMLNRPEPSGGGNSEGRPRKTAKIDLSTYYAAVDAANAAAQDRADRAEVRAMCERRLVHMWHRERLRYAQKPSPLQAFIAAREAPND